MESQARGEHLTGRDRIDPYIPFCHLIGNLWPVALDIPRHVNAATHDVDIPDLLANGRIEPQRFSQVGMGPADKHRHGLGRCGERLDNESGSRDGRDRCQCVRQGDSPKSVAALAPGLGEGMVPFERRGATGANGDVRPAHRRQELCSKRGKSIGMRLTRRDGHGAHVIMRMAEKEEQRQDSVGAAIVVDDDRNRHEVVRRLERDGCDRGQVWTRDDAQPGPVALDADGLDTQPHQQGHRRPG